MCRSKEAVVASGARRPRPKHTATTGATAPDDAAATRRAAVTPTPRKQQGADEEEEEPAREGRGRARSVSWAGADDDNAGDGKASTAATVATVKIVLKRKDAEALVARLNAQAARERKARMAELKGELRTGECCGGESPASCREAWRPQLAPIKENY
ncbi:hypothetical protein HU200_036917 [Digitaria exilis]|uniref:Uncharacterized protein n=1 Tax=Digitaria exilis TaxID=1010633 RepID=A0A835BF75_9POAL|nr:hypothetical protein HU200_036917 [Digitaria exilis]